MSETWEVLEQDQDGVLFGQLDRLTFVASRAWETVGACHRTGERHQSVPRKAPRRWWSHELVFDSKHDVFFFVGGTVLWTFVLAAGVFR